MKLNSFQVIIITRTLIKTDFTYVTQKKTHLKLYVVEKLKEK